ncbi:MAG TPA: aminoglycoside phosphotransferase family protein [Rhizomicrobium sp.]|jgi:aminoglycoside phosphotransferase (APT) family kinase protein|nr:aminoglycoside phosphotransferase family protein [Rhizomicrobium sp.]
MDDGETQALADSLAAMGLLKPDGRFTAINLTGGVSCDVYKVEFPDAPAVVVKRALPKLRVAADWRAPPERSAAEIAWLRLAGRIDPSTAPQIVGEDHAHHMFAMHFLDPKDYPLWKVELAQGRVDVDFAAVTGSKLARIHAETAGRPEIAASFDNAEQFFALRLDAYLLFAAGRHPDIAPKIRAVVDRIAEARIALMQGDISPKNILCGPGRAGTRETKSPVFLDAETACYGDPVFDLAFCINHLLLKCVWHPEHRAKYLASFLALKEAYLKGATWEKPEATGRRAAILLAMLLLARIDGKSPVEYLTGEGDRSFVRETARSFIIKGEESLDEIARVWRTGLDNRAVDEKKN